MRRVRERERERERRGEREVVGHVQGERDLGTSPRQPAGKRVGSPTSTPSYASKLIR